MIFGHSIVLSSQGSNASIKISGSVASTDTITCAKGSRSKPAVWTDDARLPAAYQEVDYIQANAVSNQNIDTGLVCKSTLRIQSKFLMSAQTGSAFIGQGVGESDSFRFFGYSNKWYLDFGSGAGYQRIYGGTLSSSTVYNVEIGNRYVKNLDTGLNIISGSSVSSFTKSYNLLLFTSDSEAGKMYYCKIYDGDTIVRDLIPCYRKSDSVAGMYDLVTDAFFTSAAEGVLTAGSDVNSYCWLISDIDEYGTWVLTVNGSSQNVLIDSANEYEVTV